MLFTYGKAQNVPQHITKRLLDYKIENKNKNNKAIIRAGQVPFAAKK
jgi:hypothetical protein